MYFLLLDRYFYPSPSMALAMQVRVRQVIPGSPGLDSLLEYPLGCCPTRSLLFNEIQLLGISTADRYTPPHRNADAQKADREGMLQYVAFSSLTYMEEFQCSLLG